MRPFTALYDACVLYPAPLRDMLMRVAIEDIFRARWTDTIHAEWMRNAVGNGALTWEKAERIRVLMDAHVDDCLVTNYEELIPGLTLPDPGDRHVLAAAITAGADVIVTFNLKDFPASSLSPHGIEAQHPDEFLMSVLNLAPGAVYRAVKRQRANLKNPPVSAEQLLDTLERQGLAQTAAALRCVTELI